MQQKLFGHTSAAGNSVTEHLKNLISEHFGVVDVPDAFLYFPEELGGLGLRNPFISLLAIRENLERDPPKKLLEFFDLEKKAYESKKREFEALNEIERRGRMKKIWGSSSDIKKRYVTCEDDQSLERLRPPFPPLEKKNQLSVLSEACKGRTTLSRPHRRKIHAIQRIHSISRDYRWVPTPYL